MFQPDITQLKKTKKGKLTRQSQSKVREHYKTNSLRTLLVKKCIQKENPNMNKKELDISTQNELKYINKNKQLDPIPNNKLDILPCIESICGVIIGYWIFHLKQINTKLDCLQIFHKNIEIPKQCQYLFKGTIKNIGGLYRWKINRKETRELLPIISRYLNLINQDVINEPSLSYEEKLKIYAGMFSFGGYVSIYNNNDMSIEYKGDYEPDIPAYICDQLKEVIDINVQENNINKNILNKIKPYVLQKYQIEVCEIINNSDDNYINVKNRIDLLNSHYL